MVKGIRKKIGELLVQEGLINPVQLKEATRIQSQFGGCLCSTLVELGYISINDALDLLSKQIGVAGINLFETGIDPAAIKTLPLKKMKEYRAIPFSLTSSGISLAMVNPRDFSAISDVEFRSGMPVQPFLALYTQVMSAIKAIEKRGEDLDSPIKGEELEILRREQQIGQEMIDLKQLLRRLIEENATDLLLSAGVPPCLKKDNELRRLPFATLTPEHLNTFAMELMSTEQKKEFAISKELDFAVTFPDIGRFRVNIFRQRGSVSISIRYIIEIIPGIDELGLPQWIEEFALKSQGLILITGPVGHGKTTTLAAIVDIINTKRKCNIITIEDPIEYLHKHKSSNVNQREVGVDTESFHSGLRHIFRQSPDVIVIGEMRDLESFSIALQAAETGHLVLSTLHSNTATSTIERIIDVFPISQQQQIRIQLAENFLLILNQRLVPAKSGSGRLLAYEKLINTYRVRNLIREGKVHQIRSLLQQSTDDFLSIDHSLARLYNEGKITLETGLKFCDNPSFFNVLTGR